MKSAISVQGAVFSGLALAVSLASIVLPRLEPRLELLVLVLLIFFLGVPHGALDTIFARQRFQLRSPRDWVIFTFGYVLLAACVVGLWWLFPAVFLTGFLLVSAFHFSGDLEKGTAGLLRLWYGGAVLVLPALLHEREVASLFGYLVAGEFAAQSASALHWLAGPWLLGLGLTLFLQVRTHWLTSMEVMSAALLATAAPPLLGFTVFFCAMHSARHALRTQNYADGMLFGQLVKKSIPPMAACAAVGAGLWLGFDSMAFEMEIIRIVFVALAALTLPHMVLIESVRMSGGFSATPLAALPALPSDAHAPGP